MKHQLSILTIPIWVLMNSCTTPERTVLIKEKRKPIQSNHTASLRHPETLKRYAVGRYIDPSNKRIMHEAHDLYRVEVDSRWNRLPQRSAKASLAKEANATKQRSHERSTSVEVSNLRRELRQEQERTLAVVAANERLQSQLAPLSQLVAEAQILVKQNAELRKQLHAANANIPEPKSVHHPKKDPLKLNGIGEWLESKNTKQNK